MGLPHNVVDYLTERPKVFRFRRSSTTLSTQLRLATVAHKSPRACGAVHLERCGENHVAKRQSRTATGLFRFGHVRAKVAQQSEEQSFLICLCGVVRRPILHISDANGGCFLNRRAVAIRGGFTKKIVLHSENVFARLLAQLEVWAGAILAVFVDGHGVAAILRLRGHVPRSRFVIFVVAAIASAGDYQNPEEEKPKCKRIAHFWPQGDWRCLLRWLGSFQ
jgi:hypothetical protein